MQYLDDLGVFLLYVIYHASALRPFTEARLIEFMHRANEASALIANDMPISDGAIKKLLAEYLSIGWVYTIQRSGESGSFQAHFLLSPYGLEALAEGIRSRVRMPQKAEAVESYYRYANQFFGLPRKGKK